MFTNLTPLVLASGSPRRRQLLETLGIPFAVVTSGIPEEVDPCLDPLEVVKLLAESKARAVARGLEGSLVIGADTIVVLEGRVLGKPADEQDAIRMLRFLRNKTHQVISGVAVVQAPGPRVEIGAVITLVQMGDYTDREIDEYVATGEVMDKAGSYAIQGLGGALVAAVEGCYDNIVGFPLCEVTALLAKFDVRPSVPGPFCQFPSGDPCPRLSAQSDP
jgi:nucleoside triphosphate pyrophosphatase